MKNELKIFLAALSFYTRIPIGKIEGWSEKMLNQSTRYFPAVGFLVGGAGALLFWGLNQVFPVSLAVILSMAGTILFTGAFHEDGFTDFCDGFGGGHTPERILEIMKDSRIGTYGSIGLLMMLGTKFLALTNIEQMHVPAILIVGHAVSRLFPVVLIHTSGYVRIDSTSKTKPVGKADSIFTLLFAILTGGAGLFLIAWQEALLCVLVLALITILFKIYIERKLGGYTGDVLGALQQLCEVGCYLSLLGYEKYL